MGRPKHRQNPKKSFGLRLDPELGKWAKDHATDFGFDNRNLMVEELLYALREGRIVIRPRGPDAFPGESVPAGSDKNPVLICWEAQ